MFDFIKRFFRRKTMENITLKELEVIIENYRMSDTYKMMETGDKYYKGYHDVLEREIKGIDDYGNKVILRNMPNNKIIDNLFKSVLEKKVNYLLTKAPSISTEKKEFSEYLLKIFDTNFLRTLFLIGKDAYKYGISWLYIYYNEQGELSFKRFDSREIIPIWSDIEHTTLDRVIRIYKHNVFNGRNFEEIENVEIYSLNGIEYYTLKSGRLTPKDKPRSYIKMGEQEFNWKRLPIIPFKANENEIPLIKGVKSIQDAINEILSDFKNDTEQNGRNTILIVKGYSGIADGFRENVNNHGVIFTDVDGDVSTLEVKINHENYKAILEILKKALIENARCFDAKNDRIGSNPNQMNIQSMYSDIDLDANALEREFQFSMHELLWFIVQHLLITNQGDFTKEKVDFIFNRDILINETQAIDDCVKSLSVLSKETVIAQHPWITDVDLELERQKAESEAIYPTLEYEEHHHEE